MYKYQHVLFLSYTHNTQSSGKSVPFPKLDVLDSLSLHSEKTLYEETFHVFPEEQTCAVDPVSGEPILPHSCSGSKLSADQPSNATASGTSTCDSGTSTCDSGHSMCTADSGTASYITDGSLFYDLFMLQHKENDRNGSS